MVEVAGVVAAVIEVFVEIGGGGGVSSGLWSEASDLAKCKDGLCGLANGLGDADGKAGMVAIVVKGGRELDLEEFSSYVMTNLPAYARPVFLRIQGELATTGTFKLVKGELRKQAYHLGEITDDLYFLPPHSENYEPLNQIAYQAVIEGRSGY